MTCPIPVMNKEIHKDKCVWVWDDEIWQYRTECGKESFDVGFPFPDPIEGKKCICGKPIHILEDK